MRHIVFYDAECPLCSTVKIAVQKLDWFRRIHWIPVQVAEGSYKFHFLKNRDIYDKIQMLSSKGRLYEGFYTVRKILTALPLTFPFSLLFYLPYIDRLLSPLYMWISKNRYDWFGRKPL
ncbi:thiol-disulfide oxidoreductase DCC family protein [Oceanobacillus profundus]|uniref:thiol-disulfide oxidoreductase DCC family protein n=1 Tax=Oceanobacillus profundus TaxID=372463 RepID=UPI0026E18B02|nr:DUF393 domain-containing protein [Oceanobacillus profundus]MDO6449181.1 DUF393 domain-containing protein [Oceanobacillus profundus]